MDLRRALHLLLVDLVLRSVRIAAPHSPSLSSSSCPQDRVQRECVLVGEEEVPLKDWLASIKKEWGITDDDEESEKDSAE